MRKVLMITTIITICGVAYGDIASVDYVDNGANGKQGLLSAGANISINDDTIAYTAELPKIATNITPGITKLYDTTGTNADGAITQNAIMTALANKQDKLPTGPSVQYGGKYNVVWDGDTGDVTLSFIPYSLTCPSDQYDFGLESCIKSSASGSVTGYIHISGSKSTDSASTVDPSTYGLTEPGTWGTTLSWGVVTGEATCLSEAEGLGRTSGYSPYGTGEYSNTFIDASKALRDKDADGADRKYCWCNMQSPAVSRWVFRNAYSSSNGCIVSCSNNCAGSARADSSFRSVVFSTVGQ